MTYRPTVRYPDLYKDYIEGVYKVTSLDRNQIIRLALFTAAHSPEFNAILQKYKLENVPLPYPNWEMDEEGAWKEQSYIKKLTNQPEEPETPSPVIDDKKQFIQNPPLIKIKNQVGIQFRIG